MAEQIGADIWRAAIPRNPEAAYRFFVDSRPEILRQYDSKVLHGYDIGVEFAYFCRTGSDYDSLRNDLLEKICNVAFRKMQLPLEMVSHGMPSLYGLRRSFVDMMKTFALRQDEANEEEISTRLKMLKETYILMRRLIRREEKK